MSHTTSVGVDELITSRKYLPGDYHCSCNYCDSNYLGEIFDVKNDSYYSQACRNKYVFKDKNKHICPGHWQGYRYAIQMFTSPNDWVFDPTVGTGTTVVEAINNGRNAIGVELEFADIAIRNVEYQYEQRSLQNYGEIIYGDISNLGTRLEKSTGKFSLVINGPPYPTLNGKSSDAPERKNLRGKDDTFDYALAENFGKFSGDLYYKKIVNMYRTTTKLLMPGGKLVIIVKDLVRKKNAFLLHNELVKRTLEEIKELKYYGCYIHRHIPQTLFMNTYNVRFPDVVIPKYQTAIVLEKRDD